MYKFFNFIEKNDGAMKEEVFFDGFENVPKLSVNRFEQKIQCVY